MKVTLGVLVLYASSISFYCANLRTGDLREEVQHTRIGLIDIDSMKSETRIGTPLTKADLLCPKSPSTSPHAPLRERALCPWQLNVTYDAARIPQNIEEAVCLCKGCLNGGTCNPVYALINVFQPRNGTYAYNQLNITVACKCDINLS